MKSKVGFLLAVLLLIALILPLATFVSCGDSLPETEGLAFELNSDNSSYSVSGIGVATDTDIVIP